MGRDTLLCEEHISTETLSAWRDELLSAAEMRRIADHADGCPACRQRLADFEDVARALHRQVELEPDDRILAGVRIRLAERRRPRWPRIAHARAWSGLGALGSVAALLLLFIYVLNSGPGLRPPVASTATLAHTATTLATDTAQVTATAATAARSYSPSVSAQTAWGSPPDKQTFTTRIDATHFFAADGILPDGHTLLGDSLTVNGDGTLSQTGTARAGLFDAETRHFTPIGVSAREPYMPECCVTDGRFVVATDSDAFGATCGLCHLRYWSYDTETGTLRQVATGSDFEEIMGSAMSHGLLAMWTFEGIQVANLATGTITRLNIAPASLMQPIRAFSWPYLVYSIEEANGTTPIRVRDMRTGKDETLAVPGTDRTTLAIAGETLFAAVTTSDGGMTTLYQMDNILSGAGGWHTIATSAGGLGLTGEANDRLVACGAVVWDRAERRFVTLDMSQSGSGGVISFNGNYLMIGISPAAERSTDLTGSHVVVYNTDTLPVRTGP